MGLNRLMMKPMNLLNHGVSKTPGLVYRRPPLLARLLNDPLFLGDGEGTGQGAAVRIDDKEDDNWNLCSFKVKVGPVMRCLFIYVGGVGAQVYPFDKHGPQETGSRLVEAYRLQEGNKFHP